MQTMGDLTYAKIRRSTTFWGEDARDRAYALGRAWSDVQANSLEIQADGNQTWTVTATWSGELLDTYQQS